MRSARNEHCVYTLLPTGAILTAKLKSKNRTFFFSFLSDGKINLKNLKYEV